MMRLFRLLAIVLFAGQALAQTQANFPTSDDTIGFTEPEASIGRKQPRLLATHPSGAIGQFHTISALTQPAGPTSFGLFLSGNYFVSKSFPEPTFITERFDSNFGISYTPWDRFEAFLGMGFLATNDEPPVNMLIRQNINWELGAKYSYPLAKAWTVGGTYIMDKRSSVSAIPNSEFALNHTILGLGTFELNPEFRFNGNLGFQINNNQRVTNNSTDPRQITILRAYEGHVLPFALGAEYLMKWLAFGLEYSLDYVFNSTAGGFASQPQRITLGAKGFPTKDKALALQLGVDLGLSSTSSTLSVEEPPYAFQFGLSYLFGMQKKYAQEQAGVQSDFPAEAKAAVLVPVGQGRISGYISNIETGDPIVDAKLYLCNNANPVITDSTGRYRSDLLNAGSCEVRIEHPDYKFATETVQVSSDSEQSFDFGLLQQSKEKGALLIRVKDSEGNSIPASISFPEHPSVEPAQTNEFGQLKINLNPGRYMVQAKSKGMVPQTREVELLSKQEPFVEFSLEPEKPAEEVIVKDTPKPVTIKVSQDKKKIEISDTIQFEVNKALLTYNSTKVLDGVAKLLKKHPEIKKIQIGGHTDASGGADSNMKLSQDRAKSVKAYLVKKGIKAERLEAKGFGETKPVADNDTEEGKYQNRRVEFKIITPTPKATKKK